MSEDIELDRKARQAVNVPNYVRMLVERDGWEAYRFHHEDGEMKVGNVNNSGGNERLFVVDTKGRPYVVANLFGIENGEPVMITRVIRVQPLQSPMLEKMLHVENPGDDPFMFDLNVDDDRILGMTSWMSVAKEGVERSYLSREGVQKGLGNMVYSLLKPYKVN